MAFNKTFGNTKTRRTIHERNRMFFCLKKFNLAFKLPWGLIRIVERWLSDRAGFSANVDRGLFGNNVSGFAGFVKTSVDDDARAHAGEPLSWLLISSKASSTRQMTSLSILMLSLYFTNVPTFDATTITKDRLLADPSLKDRTDLTPDQLHD